MTDKKPERRGLGRGLSALMGDVAPAAGTEGSAQRSPSPDRFVPIEKITPNPNQPRRSFAPEQLEELTASIREKGVIQPLILRPSRDAPDMYEIVAGERRWRAAQAAKLHDVPALIRDYDDTEVLEIAIIENIQRADLNPLEEAMGYRQLMDRFGHTQERIAEALGKSRSHIANLLRLLSLPEDVKAMISDGRISSGHARALITAENPSELAHKVEKKGLSVRETERLVRTLADQPARKPRPPSAKDADTRALEQDLSAALGMKARIDHSGQTGTGKVVVEYASLEDLDELCRILSTGRRAGLARE